MFVVEEGKYYLKVPVKLGCEIYGIDLSSVKSPEVIAEIKKDVTEHRILIFKDQDVVSGQKHVEIARWFGEIESSSFYKHPRSPHPDIFRVSNDNKEGIVGAGRTGWHIDGTFLEYPVTYSIYHMVHVSKIGPTAFAPLSEVVEGLTEERLKEWDRLWIDTQWDMLYNHNKDSPKPVHPLLLSHPVTEKKVLCFHLGIVANFIWDFGSSNERNATPDERERIKEDIYSEIVKDDNKNVYYHHWEPDLLTDTELLLLSFLLKWEPGEFIISDNLAVAHYATDQTELPVSQVGLRVLHRVTVAGTVSPQK